MQVSDNAEFRRRLEGLGEIFSAKLSPARIALYFEALRDLDVHAVIAAFNHAVKACKFFPKPAELREFAYGDPEDRTESAWLLFRNAMKRAGSYASISIADAALGETVIAMWGSWPAACAQDLSQEMWSAKRKEFGRVYRLMVQRSLDGSRYLPGICEQQNAGVKDWLKHVPVYRLDATGLSHQLTLEQSDRERTQIAAVSSGLSQLRDSTGSVLNLIPKRMEGAG